MGVPHKLEENKSFYDALENELDLNSVDGLVLCLGVFNGHVDWHVDGFDGVHGLYDVVQRNILWKECYWSFAWKKNYVFRIHGLRDKKRKVAFRL